MTATRQHVPTFDEVAALLRGAAVKIGEQLKPGDEWMHTMVMQGPEGVVLPPVNLAYWFADTGRREEFYRKLPEAVWSTDALLCAVVIPAWAAILEPNADGSPASFLDRPRATDHPDRFEQVTLTIGAHGRCESWDATVTQTPAGPRLSGDWRHVVHPDGSFCGEMVDAMRRAFA